MRKKIIQEIEKEAKKYFVGASGCHDWTHIERVKNLALHIGKEEKADLFVVEIAALLHDIGRKEEIEKRGLVCHAAYGAKMAEKILQKYGLQENVIANIAHSISAHRYKNEGDIPKTTEAKVLFDADKLDSLGAVGIGRIFLFAGNAGSKKLYTGREKQLAKSGSSLAYSKDDTAVLEYEIKLKFVKKKIYTKTGRKIAQERSLYMDDFFKRMWLEVAGKK